MDFVHDVRTVTMFDFIDSLFRKEKKALKVLSKLMDEGTPGLLLLALIMKQAESIELYHSLISGGLSTDEAVQKCGVPPRARDKFWHFVRIFPRERIGRVFPLIAHADYRLKSSSLSDSPVADPVFELASAMLFDV
jgi:DNA polymerase III delta subunit